eukprot:13889965-Heterocapsa_arctica.AAC.1
MAWSSTAWQRARLQFQPMGKTHKHGDSMKSAAQGVSLRVVMPTDPARTGGKLKYDARSRGIAMP